MRLLLKYLGVFILISSLFFSTSYKSIIRLSYEINKLEIIEKFCINKEETTFKCDGKCHLKTQLQEVEKVPSQNQDQEEVRTDYQVQLFCPIKEKLDKKKAQTKPHYFAAYSNLYHFLFVDKVVPPPKFV